MVKAVMGVAACEDGRAASPEGRASRLLPMHRCGGANHRETQLPPRCNGQAIVRSIARQMLSSPKLAKRCGRAPKARSPGNAAMRSHLDIPRSAPPAPPRLNDRKLLPWVRLPTHDAEAYLLRKLACIPLTIESISRKPYDTSSDRITPVNGSSSGRLSPRESPWTV